MDHYVLSYETSKKYQFTIEEGSRSCSAIVFDLCGCGKTQGLSGSCRGWYGRTLHAAYCSLAHLLLNHVFPRVRHQLPSSVDGVDKAEGQKRKPEKKSKSLVIDALLLLLRRPPWWQGKKVSDRKGAPVGVPQCSQRGIMLCKSCNGVCFAHLCVAKLER